MESIIKDLIMILKLLILFIYITMFEAAIITFFLWMECAE